MWKWVTHIAYTRAALHELDPMFNTFSCSEKVCGLLQSLGYRKPVIIQSMYIFKVQYFLLGSATLGTYWCKIMGTVKYCWLHTAETGCYSEKSEGGASHVVNSFICQLSVLFTHPCPWLSAYGEPLPTCTSIWKIFIYNDSVSTWKMFHTLHVTEDHVVWHQLIVAVLVVSLPFIWSTM